MSLTVHHEGLDSSVRPEKADFGDVARRISGACLGSRNLRSQFARQDLAHWQRPDALAEWHGHQ